MFTYYAAHSRSVTLAQLASELQSVTNWFSLGLHFGLPPQKLHKLASEQLSVQSTRIQMLDEWMKCDPQPTWSTVVSALTLTGELQLAKKIASKHGLCDECMHV